MNKGIFYGVGVGPGDPELLTLKAVNVIKTCEVIAVAVSGPGLEIPVFEPADIESGYPGYLEKCVAYQIVLQAVPEIAHKAKLFLPMPMMKEKERLKEIHEHNADKTQELLNKGSSVAFITLGDPSIYSTCLYVHKRLKERGNPTVLIPGIPSFCAAAARMDIGLVENSQELHIIPGSYEIEESLEKPGTKVLMKAGKKMPYVKQKVKEKHLSAQMVENCGMPGERIYRHMDEVPDETSYYSLMIIKEEK